MGKTPLESIDDAITDLTIERTRIDLKIHALEEARKLLTPVYDPLPSVTPLEKLIDPEDVGITDAVRGAYRHNAARNLGAGDVAVLITGSGFNLQKYKNPMSVIYQVISRLLESGEIKPAYPNSAEKTYQWSFEDAARRIASGEISGGTLQSLVGKTPAKSVKK